MNFLAGFHFNWLDIFLGILMLITLVRGLWVGLSRSIASLAGVLLGFWFSIHFYYAFSQKIIPFIKNELWASLLSFLILFFLVYTAFFILGIMLHSLLKALKLKWIDRLMGGVVGFAKGLLLCGIIIFLLTFFLPPNSRLLKDSLLYPKLSVVSRTIVMLVPSNIKGKFMYKWRQFLNDSDKNEKVRI